VPASKLLIPLSYASIFGGTCTLVGTSTNILASSKLVEAGEPPISMFEIGAVGLPLLMFGVAYLFFFGDRVLPVRETLTSILSDEERKEFITEAFVQHGSPMAGKSVADSALLRQQSVRVLEIIRNDVTLRVEDPKTAILREGDRLVLACRPSGFAHARSIDGIDLAPMRGVGLETISAHEGSIVEGVIGPRSTLVGKTIREIGFHQRFRVILIAIHRRGVNLRERMETLRIEAGDLLLLMGTDPAIDQLRRGGEVLLLDHPPVPSQSMRRKAPAVLAIVAGVILAVSFNVLPIVSAALIGMAAVFFTGCLEPKEGYDAIEWSILVLIYGMLGLGLAMQTTGTADLIANGLAAVADFDFISAAARPYVVLAVLYLATMVMTETLSNNATVVLMTPIALSLGAALMVDPRPFVIAACVAASASFSTPIGYQTNAFVYGPGGYRFLDFIRVGVPLQVILWLFATLTLPFVFPFHP
jgi:di/tricarboxylate transporter